MNQEKTNDLETGDRIKNKAEAVARKTRFELKNGIRNKRHFEFQGGILTYHQWITLFTGFTLIILGLTLNQGAWIYFYLLGLFKVVKDTGKTVMDSDQPKRTNLKPLTYYLIGAVIAMIIMNEAGYTMPAMDLGLATNTLEVIT